MRESNFGRDGRAAQHLHLIAGMQPFFHVAIIPAGVCPVTCWATASRGRKICILLMVVWAPSSARPQAYRAGSHIAVAMVTSASSRNT